MKKETKEKILRMLTAKLQDLPWKERILSFLYALFFVTINISIFYYVALRLPLFYSCLYMLSHLAVITAYGAIINKEANKLKQSDKT